MGPSGLDGRGCLNLGLSHLAAFTWQQLSDQFPSALSVQPQSGSPEGLSFCGSNVILYCALAVFLWFFLPSDSWAFRIQVQVIRSQMSHLSLISPTIPLHGALTGHFFLCVQIRQHLSDLNVVPVSCLYPECTPSPSPSLPNLKVKGQA